MQFFIYFFFPQASPTETVELLRPQKAGRAPSPAELAHHQNTPSVVKLLEKKKRQSCWGKRFKHILAPSCHSWLPPALGEWGHQYLGQMVRAQGGVWPRGFSTCRLVVPRLGRYTGGLTGFHEAGVRRENEMARHRNVFTSLQAKNSAWQGLRAAGSVRTLRCGCRGLGKLRHGRA